MKTKNQNVMESCPCMDVDSFETNSMNKTMEGCIGHCAGNAKWFMLIPGILLILAFALTFILNPEAARLMWLIITGSLLGLGLLFTTLASLWMKKSGKENH